MNLNQKLNEVFEGVFQQPVSVSDETSFLDIPEWDSVTQITLIFSIEQAFGVHFQGNEMAHFRNVGDLKRYLESKAVPS